jgi:hypothetical protein
MTESSKTQKEIEDEIFDKNYDAIKALSKQLNLISWWSVEEVPASALNERFPHKVVKIAYSGRWGDPQEIEFDQPKQMTWLEMWIEADKLIQLSGDLNHHYVERFVQDESNPHEFHLTTGS